MQAGAPDRRGVMAQRPDPIKARIAPFTNRTSLLVGGGVTLIVLNLVTSAEGVNILRAFGPSFPAPGPNANHTTVLDVFLQVAGLGLLVLIASVSDEGGTFALLFLAAIWLAFLYANRAWISGLANAVTPGGSSTAKTGQTPPGSTTGVTKQ